VQEGWGGDSMNVDQLRAPAMQYRVSDQLKDSASALVCVVHKYNPLASRNARLTRATALSDHLNLTPPARRAPTTSATFHLLHPPIHTCGL
jgi:hypothetical protein